MRRKRILQDLNRELNLRAPLVEPLPENFMKPKAVEFWTGNLHGQPVERMIIYLRSDVGCEFGVRTGGCLACRHFRLGTAGTRVPLDQMYVRQFHAAVEEYGLRPLVCIYNEGNMLNERELPFDQLATIIRELAAGGVRRVILESRPRYVTDEVLDLLVDNAGDMEIEIGIGMESVTDFVRNELFLKAMSRRAYERSIARLQQYGMIALAYVIIKPPFLNEAQAVADAIETAKYAFDVGTDVVSFEPIGVEPHTVVSLMERCGNFRPAWLWTVLEVARETHALGEIRLGGVQFSPRPLTLPRNCDWCTERVLAAIDQFNLTYDYDVLEEVHCDVCYPRYRQELERLSPVIREGDIRRRLVRFQKAFAPMFCQQRSEVAVLG